MVATNRHAHRVVFLIALQVALSLGTAANLVFCSTASGHVAVESAFTADCCAKSPLAETLGVVDRSDCGCVDTPLLQSPIEARSKSALWLPLPHPVVLFAAADPPGPALCCNGARAHRGSPTEPRLAALRSVVLLV